jgi:uncharacterized protein (TIGR02186 family)
MIGGDEFNLRQCFFGEHLLNQNKTLPIAIVESEKSALIASYYLPEFCWIASGGKYGCFRDENLTVLEGRKIVLFPDLGAFDQWNLKVEQTSAETLETFRKALIRNKEREGLFATGGDNITFLGGQLFRTRLHFPANVPTGFYDVEVFMLQEGRVVHAQTTPLIVRKAGLGADVFLFAHNYSAIYGIIAVLLAVAAGVIAAFVFRKS